MDFNDLTWAIAGMAAGLGLAMLAMGAMLVLDGQRMRRLMRRQRARLAMFSPDDSDAAPVLPVLPPKRVVLEVEEVEPPGPSLEIVETEPMAADVVEVTETEAPETLEESAPEPEPSPEPRPEPEHTPVPDVEATEPAPEVATAPAAAAAEPTEVKDQPEKPVSVENLFAEAFQTSAPMRVEVEPPAGEWRPAKPRSLKTPE